MLLNPLTIVEDPFTFAKEITLYELIHNDSPSDESIHQTIQTMNKALTKDYTKFRSIIFADTYFAIPEPGIDQEFMTDEEIIASSREVNVFEARINTFEWMANISLKGFGVRVYGVEHYEQNIKSIDTAFIPLGSLKNTLAA